MSIFTYGVGVIAYIFASFTVFVVLFSFLIFLFFFWLFYFFFFFFFSSRRRHTRCLSDWSSDVCSSDLGPRRAARRGRRSGGCRPSGRARRAAPDPGRARRPRPCGGSRPPGRPSRARSGRRNRAS